MHPLFTGLQQGVIGVAEDRAIPSHFTLLPQYFKNLGYKTHAVGKWHLGHSRSIMLPHNRGFDTHYGYWAGMQDYYDHTVYKDGVRDLDYQFMAVIFKIEMLIVWFHEKIKSYIVFLCLKTKILTSLYFFTYFYHVSHSGTENLKKSKQKKNL